MIARILLTGGPHGGKSTMLTRIRQLLQSLGVKVVAVPESATNLIGMLAPGDHAMLRGNDMLFAFQVAVLNQQAANERLAEKMAQALEWPLGSEDVVAMLFDRSVLDGEVFVDGLLDWTLVTQTAGVQLNDNTFREEGMPAFDVVLHLGSCAVEGEGAYAQNSPGTATTRLHDCAGALAADDALFTKYHEHRCFVHIPFHADFDAKFAVVNDALCRWVKEGLCRGNTAPAS